MKKLNSQSIVTAKGVYLCMLTVYALLREVLAIQELVGSTILTYGFFGVGVLLVVAMFLCDREPFLRKSQWLPMAFLVICVLSTLVNDKFNFLSNMKAIAWMVLYFTLLLPESKDTKAEARNRKWITTTAVMAVTAFVLVSLPMYFFDVDYIYITPTGWFLNNQGFSHQYIRLWGVFNDANTAAVYSIVAICFAVYLFTWTKKKSVRILLGFICFVLFQMVVLTGSRTAKVTFVAAAVWVGICFVLPRIEGDTGKRIAGTVLAAAIAVGVAFGVHEAVKNILPCEKAAIQSITSSSFQVSVHEAYDGFYQSSDLNIIDGYYEEKSGVPELEMTEPTVTEETKPAGDSLDRTDGKEDLSNGRFKRWKQVFEVFREMPILGASPRGISSAAKQINPDGVVAMYNYSAHNCLIEVLAGTGIIGFAVVLAMLIWLVWRILWNLFARKGGKEFLLYSTVVLVMAIEMMLTSDVFFMLSFGGIAFWMATGRIFAMVPLPTKRSNT